MVSNEHDLWKEIIDSKYGLEIGRSHSHMKSQSWWWRDLCKACGDGEEKGWFQEAIRWKVELRDKVKFWKDSWVGNIMLSNMYPRLYSLSLNQGLMVSEVGKWEENVSQLRWRRARFDWEAERSRTS